MPDITMCRSSDCPKRSHCYRAQDNEDTKYYNYTSKEMNVEDDWLFGDNIDDIKDEIEEMLIEHWENEVEYLEDKLKAFKEEE